MEHSLAGEGKEGEVELEQAFVEYDLNAGTRVRAGLFLIPVGILNETHEPDTFYGVERNPVESNIIPTTWWEAGAGVGGELAPGWSYDFAVHSGLFLEPGSGDFKVRSGRQKVSEARADTGAATGRVRFTGIAGLELGAAVNYQSDLAQDQAGDSIDAFLYEVHAAYRSGPFGVRALYASWQIDDAINMVAAGADEQSGFYVEPSYRLCERWGLFARYSEWDNQAGAGNDTEYAQMDVGVNYWLHPRVVFKLDYQSQDAPAGASEYEGVNLGVGLSF